MKRRRIFAGTIPAKTITSYATTSAEIKALEKTIDKLRKKLIPQFEAGWEQSLLGPYLLLFFYQNRSKVDWNNECFKALKRQLGKRKALKRMASITKRAGTTPIPTINVRANPYYRSKKSLKAYQAAEEVLMMLPTRSVRGHSKAS